MENGLLNGYRALSVPPKDLQVWTPPDLFSNTTGDFALGTGTGAAMKAAYELLGPLCYFEFQAQFGTAPTLGANGFNLVSVKLPVPALPAPTSDLLGGTNQVGDTISGSNVCVGNAHLTTASELKRANFFPALYQNTNGLTHYSRQCAIFLPTVDRFTITGTTTVSSGTKVTTVTHGHNRAPAIQDIKITPTSSWQTAGATQMWVDTVTATQFNVNATAAAAANLTGNLTFAWEATIAAAFLGNQSFPFDVNAGGQFKGAMLYRWR